MSKKAKTASGEQTERFQMRSSPEFMKILDDWRRQQPDLPGRAEAIRRLVETHPEIRKGARK